LPASGGKYYNIVNCSSAAKPEPAGVHNISTDILLYVGSVLVTIWGMAHFAPTARAAGKAAGAPGHLQILMRTGWVAQGIWLVFIGGITAGLCLIYGPGSEVAVTVTRLSAIMLVGAAGWLALTKRRSPGMPMKLSPVILTCAAALFVLGMGVGVHNII
jgi:hypothetical protein